LSPRKGSETVFIAGVVGADTGFIVMELFAECVVLEVEFVIEEKMLELDADAEEDPIVEGDEVVVRLPGSWPICKEGRAGTGGIALKPRVEGGGRVSRELVGDLGGVVNPTVGRSIEASDNLRG